MSKKAVLSVGLLIALVGFPQISETIYTPSLPNLSTDLQADAQTVEATLSIYFLGFALGVFLWGAVSDVYGRRKTMLAGLLLYGIASVACGIAETINSLLIWRFIQAFGASVGSVITQTILRDSFSGNERAKLFSVMSGALAFSPAIGPVLGGFISGFWGWRANFLCLELMAIFLIFWCFRRLPETRHSSQMGMNLIQFNRLLKNMITSRTLWGHILLIGSTNGILFGFYQEAPFIFIDQLGIEPGYYGFFGILIAAATIGAARFSYCLSGKFSASHLTKWGGLCTLTGSLFFTGAVVTGIFSWNSLGIIITTFALFLVFFGVGLIIPNSLSVALKAYQSIAGSAGSIFGGIYYVLIAVNTWLMSLLHDGTALPLPIYMTALSLLTLVGYRMSLLYCCSPSLESSEKACNAHDDQINSHDVIK